MEDLQLLEQNNIDAIKTLGSGVYGRVYQAFHKDYGVIAAKVMRLEKFDKKEWDAVQVLNKPEFQCPFLMKYLFARQLDNYVVIVMSYANTKSLDNIIKIHNQHLSMTTYRALAKQLLEGLKIIHSAKLIHRDIKSENILLHTEHGTTKVQIADFGLAKICAEEQMAITTCGTPLNMAPELVDIYSMGVVLFQLAAHEYPIQAKSISELQQKLKLKRINRPSVLKDDLLWDLLSQMLNFDPNRRISAEQALQHPFFTSQQAQSEITQLVKELTQNAINAQQRGETWVTEYDINSSFIVPSSDIAIFLNFNPEAEEQKILNSRLQKNINQYIPFQNQIPTMFPLQQQQLQQQQQLLYIQQDNINVPIHQFNQNFIPQQQYIQPQISFLPNLNSITQSDMLQYNQEQNNQNIQYNQNLFNQYIQLPYPPQFQHPQTQIPHLIPHLPIIPSNYNISSNNYIPLSPDIIFPTKLPQQNQFSSSINQSIDYPLPPINTLQSSSKLYSSNDKIEEEQDRDNIIPQKDEINEKENQEQNNKRKKKRKRRNKKKKNKERIYEQKQLDIEKIEDQEIEEEQKQYQQQIPVHSDIKQKKQQKKKKQQQQVIQHPIPKSKNKKQIKQQQQLEQQQLELQSTQLQTPKTSIFSKILSIFSARPSQFNNKSDKQTVLRIKHEDQERIQTETLNKPNILQLEKEVQIIKQELLHHISNELGFEYRNFFEQSLLIYQTQTFKNAINYKINIFCPCCQKEFDQDGIELHIEKQHSEAFDDYQKFMHLHDLNKQIEKAKIQLQKEREGK